MSEIQRKIAADTCRKNREKMHFENGSCLEFYSSKISDNNTSGIKGVSFYKKSGKWRAQIRYNYKNYHLGLFEDIEDAAAARKDAEEFIKENFSSGEEIIKYLKNTCHQK